MDDGRWAMLDDRNGTPEFTPAVYHFSSMISLFMIVLTWFYIVYFEVKKQNKQETVNCLETILFCLDKKVSFGCESVSEMIRHDHTLIRTTHNLSF